MPPWSARTQGVIATTLSTRAVFNIAEAQYDAAVDVNTDVIHQIAETPARIRAYTVPGSDQDPGLVGFEDLTRSGLKRNQH